MPNIVVFVEMRHGGPTAPSLFAVGEARRLADEVGASVYALLAVGDLDAAALDALAARVGRMGADKILLCQHASLGGPPLDATHGRALGAAVERIRPALVLLPAGACGAELGPRLATRLGGAFAPNADLEVATPAGPSQVRLHRRRHRDGADRFLDPVELERPVVATLRADRPPADAGSDDIEIQLIAYAAPGGPGVTVLGAKDDGRGNLDLARALVLLAPGAGPEIPQALAQAAPDVYAVVAERSRAAWAACPSIVLSVGDAPPSLGSPATRRGAAIATGAASPAGAHLIWRDGPATAGDLARALAAGTPARGPS